MWKTMWKYLKRHKILGLLTCFFHVLCSLANTVATVIMIEILQSMIDRSFKQFAFWLAMEVLFLVTSSALDGIRVWIQSRTLWMLNNDVRGDIIATLLSKSYREFHNMQSGECLSWLTNDVKYIEGYGWNCLFGLVGIIANIAFSIIALTQMHWSLLILSIFAAALIMGVPNLFKKQEEKLSNAMSTGHAQATSILKDLLLGLDVMRSFGKVARFIEHNQDVSNQFEMPKHRLTYINNWINEIIDVVNVFCQMIVLLLVGFLSVKGVISQSAIMGCGNLCGAIYNGLGKIGQVRLAILSTRPYFDKITVHADEDMGGHEREMAPLHKAISVEHLGFRYGEKPILMDTNMRFEKGGKYALTGPSGCGKSTLLKLLLGWLPEYTGKITFDGQNAKNFTSEQLQQQMSYIEQDVFLFNTTIRDNITLGENYSEEMIARAIKGSALDHDLANMPLGLDTPVGEDGSNLSGGQKQRVAIARALLHNRSILLVDEGTSALDQKNADIVEQSLLNNPDLTLILISHHLSDERKKQFTKVYEMEPVAYASLPS